MAEIDSSALTGKLGEAVHAVSIALDALRVPSMIIGGIAVIARGVVRFTRDVDVTVAGGDISLEEVVEVFAHTRLSRESRTRPQDLERLLMLYGSQLDLAALRTVIAELLDAIGETERLAAFDRLVERTDLPVIPKAIGKRKNLP